MGRGQTAILIKVPGDIPPGKIVAVELGFRELRLTLSEPVEAVASAGDNTVAGDPGIIHQMMLTDGQSSTAIVGRGLRSLIQGKTEPWLTTARRCLKPRKAAEKQKAALQQSSYAGEV